MTFLFFFFFNDTATTEIYTLSLHDALPIWPPDQALETMPEVVRQMHTASGLLDELAGGTTLTDAEEQVLSYVREHVKESGKAPLCGNSVGTDRGFLLRDMATLEDYLH